MKPKPKAKKKPIDSTMRNVRAANKKITELAARVFDVEEWLNRIEVEMCEILEKLERKGKR